MSHSSWHSYWREQDFASTTALRAQLKNMRRQLDPDYAREAAAVVCRRLLEQLGPTPGRVGVYLSGKGELSLDPLIAELQRQPGTVIYAPRVVDAQRMEFRHLPDKPEMIEVNRYGLREPPAQANAIEPGRLDWLLMPLLGFDHLGHRLGMGGGYYDRALADCREQSRPRRIGIGFAQQQVERLTQQPWDVPCHAILTPAGWYHCASRTTSRARQAKETPPWPTG